MKTVSKFFVFTFVASWSCFVPVALLTHFYASGEATITPIQQLLIFIGAIAPGIVALLMSRSESGAVSNLLNSAVKWQVHFKWYVFAIAFMAAIKLVVALLHKIIFGAWPTIGKEPIYIMLVAIVFSTWAQAGEEIGWRGFALPRLSSKFGLATATVVLGIVWACWHLPLFFLKGADTFQQSFTLYLLQVTALSVIIGWLYWRTGRSLMLPMILHAAVNNTKDIVPSADPQPPGVWALSHSSVAWLTVMLLWLCGGYFLYDMRNV